MIDIRSFQILMSPDPVADVELSARILAEGRIVEARIFHASIKAKKAEAAPAVAALNETFGKVATDLVIWTSEHI